MLSSAIAFAFVFGTLAPGVGMMTATLISAVYLNIVG